MHHLIFIAVASAFKASLQTQRARAPVMQYEVQAENIKIFGETKPCLLEPPSRNCVAT